MKVVLRVIICILAFIGVPFFTSLAMLICEVYTPILGIPVFGLPAVCIGVFAYAAFGNQSNSKDETQKGEP